MINNTACLCFFVIAIFGPIVGFTEVDQNTNSSKSSLQNAMNKRVLVFSPHPDDDIIGCGGSIARHLKVGNSVDIVCMTSGDAGSLVYSKAELAQKREAEAINAGKKLGLNNYIFLRNPDGYLEYDKKNLVEVTNLIRKLKPHIIYIPHENDGHTDHKTTYKIVAEAVGRAAGPWFQECDGAPWSVETVLCYEVWTPLQNVNYAEDISEFLNVKLQALREHKSQIADIDYVEAVEGLNRYRGIMKGKSKYCECFFILNTSHI